MGAWHSRAPIDRFEQLQRRFRTTPVDRLKRLVAQHKFDLNATSAELALWSPEELKQPINDDKGRKIFYWRIPLDQCQSQSTGRAWVKCIAAPRTGCS